MTPFSLFPTHIFRDALSDETLIEPLHNACIDCAEQDQAGHDWCEREGYAGYTSYASLDDLERRYPAVEDLFTYLDTMAEKAALALQWDMSGLALERSGVWVNILGEGGGHSGHIHPGNVLSGTVYIAMPEGAGDIKFEDPRLGLKMAAPPLHDKAAQSEKRFVYVVPKVGEILMWESWLRHEVMPSKSEDFRVSISFNYRVQPI